eukprot:CAMPEP_0113491666 /NCGR_PEP_ID=MMETSP0014_2-20120614/27672_1 /TAXON_ID=2857 /ORGANISM="Nitzschia sp." /LENGTH=348 /DNA_ID=CAMNT_0000385461 /DNA_START=1 /DNA_END=1048 /DNA_ORIENTATION=+ /assembly_acc=CAM_ASM_000159
MDGSSSSTTTNIIYSSRRKALKIQQRKAVNNGDGDRDSSIGLSLAVVAIDRPSVRNAINDDVYLDLIDILHQTSQDSQSAGIILTGAGSYFTSGADLKLFFNGSSSSSSSSSSSTKKKDTRPTLEKPAGRFMMTLLEYPKLICAAVNGPAVGIGTTLLLHCDLVFASRRHAKFWSPFPRRIALVPELCSSVTFLSTMGLAKTNELLLLGNEIDAPTAYTWGICSRLVDDNTGSIDDVKDPFHPTSLASRMAVEIETKLLMLPRSTRTIEYFVSMVRKSQTRNINLRQVCIDELQKLDERKSFGDMDVAIESLQRSMREKKKKKEEYTKSKNIAAGSDDEKIIQSINKP